jgi:hypothetical protein
VSTCWVPDHKDVVRNERAYSLAKAAAKKTPSTHTTSLAMTGIRIRALVHHEWKQVLTRYTLQLTNYSTYAAQYSWRIRKKLSIPLGTRQETASAFYQLKLGHGYNKAYLFCIGKTDSPRCSCGALQTPEYLLLSCKWLRQDRRILHHDLSNARLTLPLLLNTKQGIQATLAFITRTKVGTHKWHLGQDIDD